MIIRPLSMARATGTIRAGAIALTLGLVLATSCASAASDSNSGAKKKSVTSELTKIQQSHYQHLQQLWSERHIPDGLPKATGPVTARNSHVPTVGIEVKNVDYEIADGIGFYVKSLDGALVPNKKGAPVDFDDPYSYKIHIYHGQVTVRPKDLDALFNRYILSYAPRALSSIQAHISDGQLTVDTGSRLFDFLPPIGGIPTTLVGPMRLTSDGKLAYTPNTVKNFGVPVLGLLSSLGIKLSTLTPLDREGVHLDGDKLLLTPGSVFPAPRLTIDHIDSAKLTDKGLTLTFSSDKGDPHFQNPPGHNDSYIWLQSGDARFFNVVLVNTRLLMVNKDHKRLHFHLYRYRSQVAAGQIDATTDGTLIVRVPNNFKMPSSAPQVTENAKPKTH